MGLARIKITKDLLFDALGFPKGTVLRGCQMSPLSKEDMMEITIAHNDLPEVDVNNIPFISPIYHRTNFDWNLP